MTKQPKPNPIVKVPSKPTDDSVWMIEDKTLREIADHIAAISNLLPQRMWFRLARPDDFGGEK